MTTCWLIAKVITGSIPGGANILFNLLFFLKIIFLHSILVSRQTVISLCSVFFMNPIPEYRHIMNKEPMDYLVTSYSLILAASNHFTGTLAG